MGGHWQLGRKTDRFWWGQHIHPGMPFDRPDKPLGNGGCAKQYKTADDDTQSIPRRTAPPEHIETCNGHRQNSENRPEFPEQQGLHPEHSAGQTVTV